MSSEEIKQIKETLKYYETTKTEPTYCEELITTGELKRIVEEIERLNNIINKAIEYEEESYNETVEGIEGIAKFFSKRNETLLKILKGEIK